MRLKFLFFPIILVISVAIFIGYIWPSIGNVKKINEDRIAKSAELQAVQEKQAAIESIGKKISNNAEVESVVKDYLPENKIEERIISGINYLAGDANVSLMDISLSSAKNTLALASIPVSDPSVGVASLGAISSANPVNGQVVSNNASLMQATSAKISLVGDYAKIRIFIDSLQRMPILNTITSVNITKQKSETKDAGAAAGAGSPEVAKSTELSLAADIEVDFGYLGVAKTDSQQVEKLKADLDSATADALKKYISQKSQLVGSGSDTKGKINPFVIN